MYKRNEHNILHGEVYSEHLTEECHARDTPNMFVCMLCEFVSVDLEV